VSGDVKPNAGGGGARRNKNRRRRKPAAPPKPNELWRPVAQLPPPDPIAPTADPAAFLHSLGDPPLQGQGAVAEHYLAAVVERAAGLATALAAAGGILATDRADD
jgi:hypothetical protein